MQQLMILLVIGSPSTCQRVKQPIPPSARSLPADSPTSEQSQQDRKR